MNRALRAATVGVLLFSPVALSACSAGQVTQTESQERDHIGAQARVGDLTLRSARLDHPRGGLYERGDDAELLVAIVNDGAEADTLTGVEGEGFGSAEIEGSGTTSGTRSPRGGEIEIPADGAVFVGTDGPTVTLTGLSQSLTTGQIIEVTFTFENAGEVTVPVTVANPGESLERGEAFDFHQEESGGDEARERESGDSE